MTSDEIVAHANRLWDRWSQEFNVVGNNTMARQFWEDMPAETQPQGETPRVAPPVVQNSSVSLPVSLQIPDSTHRLDGELVVTVHVSFRPLTHPGADLMPLVNGYNQQLAEMSLRMERDLTEKFTELMGQGGIAQERPVTQAIARDPIADHIRGLTTPSANATLDSDEPAQPSREPVGGIVGDLHRIAFGED